MKKNGMVLSAAAVLFIFVSLGSAFGNEVIWDDISRGNLNLKTVLVDPDDSRIIYIGSSNAVFKTEDGGQTWRNILSVKGQSKAVNFLLLDPFNRNFVYAATAGGLFYSPNQGKSWERIFKGRDYLENECAVLAVLPSGLYLGTKAGLFVSLDKGRRWKRERAVVGSSRVLAIASSLKEPGCIYIVSGDGVFKTINGGESWEKIFAVTSSENEEYAQEEAGEEGEEEGNPSIKYVAIDPNNLNYLYLAASRGIYKSQDKGKTWGSVSDYGLLGKEAEFLLVSPESAVYVITKAGVFRRKGESWHELSLGLPASAGINSLCLDKEGRLYAACDKGLFRAAEGSPAKFNTAVIDLYLKDEPQINNVQQAAIKYAEVEPEKIIRWRKQAARRAWLPKITVDMDRDMDRTTSNSIWGTYPSNGTPGRYFAGPDDVTKYNNKNWGVSLTWELSDLIFSGDQTDIDVRSRLTAQLREDVLDEVTKLYFERVRLKMELDSISIEDRNKRFEKELKLRELTASLDALTGGYFSGSIK